MDGSPSMSPLVVLESSAAARERGLHPDRGRRSECLRYPSGYRVRNSCRVSPQLCRVAEFLRCNTKRNGGIRQIPDPPGTF